MTDLISKFVKIEEKIAREKGGFTLFGIFQRDNPFGKWDVVVSAPWLDRNDRKSWYYIVESIESVLGKQGLLNLSKFALLDESDHFVRAINATFDVEHGREEVWNRTFDGISVDHGYIITSKKPSK
jgi:hypothetical protein